MYRTDFWTLWEKARVGWSERTASKHVYYQGWNRSPVQVGCMRQVFRAGALGRPRGMGWGGRWEGGSGWGTHVNPWLIHVSVWQKPLQYCKVISLQLIKINGKKKRNGVITIYLCGFSWSLLLLLWPHMLSWNTVSFWSQYKCQLILGLPDSSGSLLEVQKTSALWPWNNWRLSGPPSVRSALSASLFPIGEGLGFLRRVWLF